MYDFSEHLRCYFCFVTLQRAESLWSQDWCSEVGKHNYEEHINFPGDMGQMSWFSKNCKDFSRPRWKKEKEHSRQLFINYRDRKVQRKAWKLLISKVPKRAWRMTRPGRKVARELLCRLGYLAFIIWCYEGFSTQNWRNKWWQRITGFNYKSMLHV